MYVLVHGAGMGASCWDRLIPHLDAPAVALDLPGRGSRRNVPIEKVTLEDCADALRETLRDVESDDIVMVAHSFAGVTVPRVMAEFAPRLRHVAFLSAVVPPDGTSVLDQIDPSVREAAFAPRSPVASTAGSPGRTDDAVQRPGPRSHRMDPRPGGRRLLGPAHRDCGSRRPHGRGPRTYIRLTKDACYPPELQERSVSIVGGDVAYLDTGHMAMVAAPERLAQTLRELR